MGIEDQNWVKNNREYRDEFPTLGGKSRKQRAQNTIEQRTLGDFPLFENSVNKAKKPAKFSDQLSQIMRKENMKEKHKQ